MASSTRPRLGFIGLGIMGTAMVQRLLEQGWAVTAWNLEPERVPPLEAAGAVAAATPAAVAAASDIVLLCVLHTEAVQACVFGPGGIVEADGTGKLLVDHSTIDPERTRAMAAELQARTGMHWIDAPVSGGPLGARAGSLTVMAGGAAEDIAAARPVMADLAVNFTPMGQVGAGQTAKMINQAIVGSGYVVLAEALRLAEQAGIAADQLPHCLAGGHADSTLLQQLYPQMQARAFEPPRSYARQLLKDLKAVQAFARGLSLDLPMVELATRRYTEYVEEQGHGLRDTASIVDLYRPRS
ncbi:MAG TPA: NAD(P)-dependent oxidoreductase [Ramlibacter sp.]|nr:NAD(P)-dependent oxidoreductase [Ramlibacter sp.]